MAGCGELLGTYLDRANALSVTTDGDGSTFSMNGIDLAAAEYTTALGSSIDTTPNASTALTNINAAITGRWNGELV